MNDTEKPRLVPLSSMARRLRVTAAWLKSEAEAGRVPALKADRRFLFNPETVELSLLERATAAPSNGEGTARE